MKLLFLLQILVCYGIIACAEEQGRDPVLNNSDIGSSNNEIFIFIVAQTEVAGDYSICFRKLGTNNCMSSDSEGKFEAMRFSAYGGENVSILATYEDRDLSCNASIPVEKEGAQGTMAVTITFPRNEDCTIEWKYRLT